MRKAEKQRIIEEGFKGYRKAKRICRTCEFYMGKGLVCLEQVIVVETEKNNTCEGWKISLNVFIKQVDKLGEELRQVYLADFIDFDIALL